MADQKIKMSTTTLVLAGIVGILALSSFRTSSDGDSLFAGNSQFPPEPDPVQEPEKWQRWLSQVLAVAGTIAALFAPGGPFSKKKNNPTTQANIFNGINRRFNTSFSLTNSPYTQFNNNTGGGFGGFGGFGSGGGLFGGGLFGG